MTQAEPTPQPTQRQQRTEKPLAPQIKSTPPVAKISNTITSPSTFEEAEKSFHKTAESSAITRDKLRFRLEEKLERKYPFLARKRGWEGEVLLGFRIDSDGEINDIRVTRSSGYPILDKSAVASLSKVKRVAMNSIALAEGIEMDLAISYRLQDI